MPRSETPPASRTIPDRVRAWAARLPHRTRSDSPSAAATARATAEAVRRPGAGSPPRSAPGRRTPKYHSLRDLT